MRGDTAFQTGLRNQRLKIIKSSLHWLKSMDGASPVWENSRMQRLHAPICAYVEESFIFTDQQLQKPHDLRFENLRSLETIERRKMETTTIEP